MASMLRMERVTLDKYREFLHRLCRTCGQRANKEVDETKGKKIKLVASYKEQVKATYGVNIDQDEDDIHPKNICKTCYSKLFLKSKRSAYEWCCHSRTGQCTVCMLFTQQSKGGRPKKTNTGAGRPKQVETPTTHFDMLRSNMEERNLPKLTESSKFAPTSDMFKCPICRHFLRWPVAIPCEHVYCLQCVETMEQKHTNQCTVCGVKYSFREVQLVKGHFMETLISSGLKCNKCNEVVSLTELSLHECDPDSITKGIETFLKTPLTSPLTSTLEKLGTHILKTKLAQSTDHVSATFKTGGQVGW